MDSFQIPLGQLQANCVVLWEDPKQALVVDPGAEAERLVAELESRGVRPGLVVNTHGHFDHTGAVGALVAKYGCDYLTHADEDGILKQVPAGTRMWGVEVAEVPEPSGHFEHGQVLDIGGLRVECIHTPGHTPGSTCFHVLGSHWVLTGDTLFQRSVGRSDFPGGDHDALMASIRDRLYALDPGTRVTPGHGPDTSIGDEAAQNPFVRAATEST